MSDISFNCPHCGNKLAVDETAAGLAISCPVCSNSIVIGADSGSPAEAAPDKRPSNGKGKFAGLMLAGLAIFAAVIGAFLWWHTRSLPPKSPNSLATTVPPVSSSNNGLVATFEKQQQLVNLANTGEPQAVLNLLDQEPTLENSLALLAKTPLSWALARGPDNAREMLSDTVSNMPAMLRATDSPSGCVWLECLESQPDESGLRPVVKSFPNHPQFMEGIKYQRGFWSRGWDASYNVLLNGRAKRLSILIGLDDSTGTNGHLRFLISADGRCVGDSGLIVGTHRPKLVSVDLTGIQKLKFRVDTGGKVNWVDPAIAGALLELTPNENIHAAAVSGRVEELNQLLDQDQSRITAVDGLLGMTPFWAACMGGQTESALAIAHHGADVNATNTIGATILHTAATKGWDQAIYPACAAGSNPRLRNSAGQTAHEIAVAKNNFKVLAKLSEAELWLVPQDPAGPAPDFTVNDFDGKKVMLSSFRGKIVALFFLCTMPWDKSFHYTWLDYAQRLNDSPAGKQGRLVVLVATPEDPKSIRDFLQDRGYNLRGLSDHNDNIRKTLGLYAMPAVLIDSEGAIRWQRRMWQRNELDDDGLFLATEKLLANNYQYRPSFPEGAKAGKASSEQLLYDFEDGFENWKTMGNCWEKMPATDALYPGLVKGYKGRSFLSTFGSRGSGATGLAVSPSFKISKPFLHFLVGGGDFPDHCAVALVSDGCTVRRATGRNTADLEPICWDVRDLIGKQVCLEVFDSGTAEPRDFIMLDQVVASDSTAWPASYAKRFDPDDPKDSAEVANSIPPSYKALQAGDSHEITIPGTTYRLERTNTIRWPDRPADWLEFVFEAPPTHHAQTMQSFSITLEADGKSYQGHPELTGRPLMGPAYVCYVPASLVPDRRGVVKISCELTANRLQILQGKTLEKPLPDTLRRTLTQSVHYNYTNQLMLQYITHYKLWRWDGETEAAYLLRAYRFFQRNFSYVNVGWGGWPTYHSELGAFDRLATDCGMAAPMTVLLRANGIPAAEGQGGWVGDNGAPFGAHVKGLAFIQNVGWLTFGVSPGVGGLCDPFAPGSRQGDNFLAEWVGDLPATYPIPDPVGATNVLRGSMDGGPWWQSWVVSRVPEPPAEYLLDPRKAQIKDARGSTFASQPQCHPDFDGDHYVFGGVASTNDNLDYMAYGMASVRGVMKMGMVSCAHPDANVIQAEWPLQAKAGQKLHFICCLTDQAVQKTRQGAKIQVRLSGEGKDSEVLTDQFKPGDQRVIEVTKTLTGLESSLVLKFDNCGKEYWTVLYCDASLE